MWLTISMSSLTVAFPWLKDESAAKLLLMLAAMVALFLAGRWIAARGESSAHDPSLMGNAEFSAHPMMNAVEDVPALDASVHPEMDFGEVILRKLYFAGFDAATGPDDPANFVDEATVEVYSKRTASLFENTFTVATPAGLDHMLREKQWESLYSPQIFIVNRYNLKAIREAIAERLLEDLELPRPSTIGDSSRLLG